MLYPVIGASIKFTLIFLPRIFTSFTQPMLVQSTGSARSPIDGQKPKRGAPSRTRSEERSAAKRALILDGGPRGGYRRRGLIFGLTGISSSKLEKKRVQVPVAVFSQGRPWVLVMAFPTPEVQSATWSSSSAART